MATEQFDPNTELAVVKTKRAELKRKNYRKSRLEKYRSELVALRQAGASGQDLAYWLRTKHRLRIHRSTIARYLSTLPELEMISSKDAGVSASAANTEQDHQDTLMDCPGRN